MSLSKPIRDRSKSLTIDFDKMITERMLELLILRDMLLQKGVGREYRESRMWNRYFELKAEFLKPYRI